MVSIIIPIYKRTPLSIIKLKNMAVATSGNYERFFVEDNQYINHIFSGITFETSNNYKSISVIAESTEKADGFATLFYLLNIEEIKKHCEKFNVPVLILKNNDITVKLCNWEKYE